MTADWRELGEIVFAITQPLSTPADSLAMSNNGLELDLWLLALWSRSGLNADALWICVHETSMQWFARCTIRAQA